MDDADRLNGALLGGAFGDAVGGPFEGAASEQIPPRPCEAFDPSSVSFSDDTQLTLATCQTLIRTRGVVDPAELAAEFLAWFRAGRLSGLGASTLKALIDLEAGGHWALVGRKGEQAAGNGAAMRIAPMAFFVNPQSTADRRALRDVCRITHHNEEAYAGALAVVLAIELIRIDQWSNDRSALLAVTNSLIDSVTRDKLVEMAGETNLSVNAAARKYGCSGYVADSVPLALFAASRVTESNFREVLDEVIAAGGDTDTNAAIFGNIAGALLGHSGLPEPVRAIDHDGELCSIGTALGKLIGS